MRASPTRSPRTGGTTRGGWPLLWVVAAAAWLVALGVRFGGGVAGTDEFWYAGDLRMTGATGEAVSNHVYPLYAASAPAGVLPPRMHDTPVTSVASWVYAALGGGPGADGVAWTVVGVTLAVATAGVVAATARLLGGSGGWGAVAFAVFPSTTWAALSPLSEVSLAFGVAVLVGASVAAERTGRGAWWVVAGAAGGLLVWGRSNFVLLLLAWVGWLVWSGWHAHRPRVIPQARRHRLAAARATGGAAPDGLDAAPQGHGPHAEAASEEPAGGGREVAWRAAGAAVALAVVVGHALVARPYPNAGLAATFMVGAAGRSSNMDFYFVPVAFDPSIFVDKAGRGMWRALTPRTSGEWTTVLPIVVAALVGVLGGRGRSDGRGRGGRGGPGGRAWSAMVVLTAASFVTYVATCAVFQPQTRYLYAAAPLAAVLLDVAVSRSWRAGRSRTRGVVAALTCLVVAVGLGRSWHVAQTLRTAGERAAVSTAQLEAALAPLVDDGRAVLVLAPGNATDIAVAYAAVPHPVISVDPALVPPEHARRLAREWHVSAVVARPVDAAYLSAVTGVPVGDLSHPVTRGFVVRPARF